MNTSSELASGSAVESNEGKCIVVGIDGSTNNLSAVTWAANEAERTGRPLRVVTATEEMIIRRPPFVTDHVEPLDFTVFVSDMVERVADNVKHDHPSVEVISDVRLTETLGGLLEEAEQAELMVVGKRGVGALERMTVGSTSIALAGRSTVPVVVVPDSWRHEGHDAESVLVGVDVQHDNEHLLAFAFERAQELGVPLVALHVWDTHPSIVLNEDDKRRWGDQALNAVEAALTPWRARFPEVEAIAAERHARPAAGILDWADDAQLLVLGRKSSGHSLIGLGFGSMVRTVLHYSTRPVAVVPTKA